MGNLDLYNLVKTVPDNAKKPIEAGRLKGMTDINPMWRIKTLTEVFGACGVGWYYTKDSDRIERCEETKESAVFVDVTLYVKIDGEWSKGIHGTGGSMLVSSERNGLHVSDEAFKMAETDALSVACKNLGIGADVYFEKDADKYTVIEQKKCCCAVCGKPFVAYTASNGQQYTAEQVFALAKQANVDGVARCKDCSEKAGTRK